MVPDNRPDSLASKRAVLELMGWRFFYNNDKSPPTTWIAVVPKGYPLPEVDGVPVTSMTVKSEKRVIEWAWEASQQMGVLMVD